MKPFLIALSIAAIAGAPGLHAQTITIDQPPVALPAQASNSTDAASQPMLEKHLLSMNWARVSGTRDASGKLVAQCTVETNPVFAGARQRMATEANTTKTTTTLHK
ncbi:MAG: hypothetical protein L0H70_10640 [Xanthomonadales bacterium]|nr:hypothetical protein [Xanthomonadales bacterium]